jgi:hypothetical protein
MEVVEAREEREKKKKKKKGGGRSETKSAVSELDLATPGSSSPLLSTVLAPLASTPLGLEVDKGKGNNKGY